MIIKGIENCNVNEELFNLNLNFQIINSNCVATEKHILHAINQAKTKKNITNNFWMEILVRASGQRQISTAIKKLGVKGNNVDICVICDNIETFNKILEITKGKVNDNLLSLNLYKINIIKEIFNINENIDNIINNNNTNNTNDSSINEYDYLIKRVCEKISVIEIIY